MHPRQEIAVDSNCSGKMECDRTSNAAAGLSAMLPRCNSSFRWRQHLAAVLANLGSFSSGMSVAWTSSAQAVLRGEAPGSPLRLSLEESSWASAMLPVGAAVGSFPFGLMAQRLGRKTALQMHVPIVLAGWLLILFAEDRAWMVHLARFVLGMSVGGCGVVVSLYNEEIAEVSVRGTLGSYLDLITSSGMLFSYILGAFLPYFWYTALSLAPPVLFLLTFSWMPESPDFLVGRGRREDALRSLRWLRGPDADVQAELDVLEKTAERPDEQQPRGAVFGGCCSAPRIDRNTAKAVALAVGVLTFSQSHGGIAFLYYTADVFKEAGTNLAPEIASILVGVVFTAGTFLPTLIVDRLGRRPLLCATYLVMGLCQLCMSVYSYLGAEGYNMDAWRWVPLAALITFMASLSMGPSSLSWFLAIELLPVSVRKWSLPLGICLGRVVVLIFIKEYPPMVVELGQDITYGIFCLMCFVNIVFTIAFIPETKGKTREEIQMEMRGKKKDTKHENELC